MLYSVYQYLFQVPRSLSLTHLPIFKQLNLRQVFSECMQLQTLLNDPQSIYRQYLDFEGLDCVLAFHTQI